MWAYHIVSVHLHCIYFYEYKENVLFFFLYMYAWIIGAIQVLRNAIFLEIGPPPTPS